MEQIKTNSKPYKQGSPEWHTARSKGIGGSDIAAIMGFNPWKTPYQVWAEKTGRSKGTEANEKMKIGSAIEDFIASQYAKRTGLKVKRSNKFKLCDAYPFIGGSVDRLVFDPDRGGWGILEMKNVSTESFKNTFLGAVPDYYYLQVQTYMLVFGMSFADLFVFVGGERFEVFHIERSEPVINSIIEAARNFWFNFVQTDIAPAVVSKDDLKLKYGSEDFMPEMKEATEEISGLVEHLVKIKNEIKILENEKELAELKIMDFCGEYEGLTFENKPLLTWKWQIATRFDSKAFKESDPQTYKKFEKSSESRVLRIKAKD